MALASYLTSAMMPTVTHPGGAGAAQLAGAAPFQPSITVFGLTGRPNEKVTVSPLSALPATLPGPFSTCTSIWLRLMVTPGDVCVFPAASRAMAVTTCCPWGTPVVSHIVVNGSSEISGPTVFPSTLNWTPSTPRLSSARAVSFTRQQT